MPLRLCWMVDSGLWWSPSTTFYWWLRPGRPWTQQGETARTSPASAWPWWEFCWLEFLEKQKTSNDHKCYWSASQASLAMKQLKRGKSSFYCTLRPFAKVSGKMEKLAADLRLEMFQRIRSIRWAWDKRPYQTLQFIVMTPGHLLYFVPKVPKGILYQQ